MLKSWTADELTRIAPLCATASTWARVIAAAAPIFDILDTTDRLTMWTAHIVHESAGLRVFEEDLRYSAERLREMWPKRFPSWDIARQYAGTPEAIANFVYSDRNGNGPAASGDGWRFRGRGPIQITGRANYRAAGVALGQPLEDEPELLLDPEIGALSAAWYWADHGCNALADLGLFGDVTRAINGALTGLEARSALLLRCRKVLASRSAA